MKKLSVLKLGQAIVETAEMIAQNSGRETADVLIEALASVSAQLRDENKRRSVAARRQSRRRVGRKRAG